jgi:tetratricopeptide (TPR) repeat protein
MNAIFILLAALLLSGQPQKGPLTLSGVVTDSKTHLPIEGAHVSLVGNLATHDVDTDVSGNFVLVLSSTVQPAQIVRLLVKKDSYKTYGRDISVAPALTLQVPLESAAVRKPSPLPPKRFLYVQGYVSTDGARVPGAEVSIQGGPSPVPTDKTGAFRIENLKPPFKVGLPVTFEVVGWIVVDPKLGEFGRTYFPDPAAEPTPLHVLKAGNPAFLQRPSIDGVVGQRVFFFEESEMKLGNDTYLPSFAPSVLAEHSEFRAVSMNGGTNFFPGILSGTASGFGAEGKEQDRSDWDRFLHLKALEIRIPLKELISAVEKWAEHPETEYERGLVALYRDDYDRAATEFRAALDSGSEQKEQLLMCVAYAEFRRGNFAESSLFLRRLAILHPEDTVVQRNLAIVGRKEELAEQSKAVDQKRLEICRRIMGYFARDEVSMLRGFFDAPMTASASEHGIGRLFDEVTKNAGSFELILEQSAESQPNQPTKYVTKSRFEKGEIEMVILFDNNNLIDRITFMYPVTHTEWEFPR